jgi:hypothetical protein
MSKYLFNQVGLISGLLQLSKKIWAKKLKNGVPTLILMVNGLVVYLFILLFKYGERGIMASWLILNVASNPYLEDSNFPIVLKL